MQFFLIALLLVVSSFMGCSRDEAKKCAEPGQPRCDAPSAIDKSKTDGGETDPLKSGY